ncbi:MAG: hypothetical protein RBT60_10975 [Candidatus Krumholzibacteria bacterium]|jgi:hypothetical protein|nr:hypothetical protein [Candidatus Krumholzibacteria bacterium]
MDNSSLGSLGATPVQAIGAFMAVFVLLILALKLLQRWQPGHQRDASVRLLSVRRLGPRRELQTLRVGGEVHTLYRQDNALVLLKSEPWQAWADAADLPAGGQPARQPRLLALAAAAGERLRSGRKP